MVMRHRRAGVTRHHTLIDRVAFDALGILPGVNHVNPGHIYHTAGSIVDRIRVTRATPTGLRVLIRSPRAVQEAFVVTTAPEEVSAHIAQLNARLMGNKASPNHRHA